MISSPPHLSISVSTSCNVPEEPVESDAEGFAAIFGMGKEGRGAMGRRRLSCYFFAGSLHFSQRWPTIQMVRTDLEIDVLRNPDLIVVL